MSTAIVDPLSIGTELVKVEELMQAAPMIADEATLEQAFAYRHRLGEIMKAIATEFAPFKKSAHALWRQLCDRENELLDPVRARDLDTAKAIGAYKERADAARREAERAEADRRKAAQDQYAIAEAAALERNGDRASAAMVLAEAMAAPPPVVVLPDRVRAVAGAKFVRRWHFRIVDEALVPREYLMIDEKKLGGYCRAMKASAHVPGVEFFHTDDPVR